MTASPDSQDVRLTRSLEYRDLLAYGLAYIAPVAPLSTLGFVWAASGGLIALAYLLGAICMYFTAKSYAVMTEVVPSAGSVYGIARYCLGGFPGFLAGWLVLLDYLLIPSLIFLLMSVGMGTLMPQIDRATWIIILVSIALLINWFGVTVTSRVNMLSVAAQFIIVLGLLILGLHALLKGHGGGLDLQPFYSSELFSLGKVFSATSICILSYLGFDAISTLSEEVKSDDRKLIGRAIVNVLLISGVLCVLITWILGCLMRDVRVDDPAAAIFSLTAQHFGPIYAIALAWLLALTVGFTNALPMQIGVARVLFAMGRDRQLPAMFATLHKTHRTPYIAMLFSTVLSLVIALLMRNDIDGLASFVNFGALSAFLFLHVSVLVHMGWKQRSKQIFAHWCVPIAGIAVVLMVFTGMAPIALKLGAAWLVVGVVYGLFLRARHRVELAV
ncbi:APC family permease [Herbaspirillum rubrisubalbicans]|uniref:Amino acid permease n=1 Tax=Herbaspirillum rubrisubalbicans Os34 TaxID=1235827 RepID=A0A6M3ZSN8_9BURK|nr:APC family permease [Herbaspirillum rubrisubalbicans]MCP1572696.1 amino acid transporter [Herbaspirillum rubrisubalbicans]QJQ01283.1 amino acid permease [Herbaspirillum rubrisubalbicans Os34]